MGTWRYEQQRGPAVGVADVRGIDPRVDAPNIERYLTEDYTHLVDGKQLDRDGFLRHLDVVRGVTADVEFRIEDLVADTLMIAERHFISATKTDGSTMTAEVIALHHLREGRVSRIVELTRLASGAESDRDLGSRT